MGYSPWSPKESDMTERLHFHFGLDMTDNGEGRGKGWYQCTKDMAIASTHTPIHHTHTHTAYLRQAREDIKQLSDKCIQSSGKRSR